LKKIAESMRSLPVVSFGATVCVLDEAASELGELECVVDRLPKSGDRHPLAPGMIVYVEINGQPQRGHVKGIEAGSIHVKINGRGSWYDPADVYYTREGLWENQRHDVH